jgi:hypothetical protein
MIVKVQISLESADNVRRVLVYNEDRSFAYQGGINDEVLASMKLYGRPKAYFEAEVVKGVIEIGEEVEAQDW